MISRAFLIGALGCALLLVGLTAPARGQSVDTRWSPFVGCWEPVDAGTEAGLLCFRPTVQGVEMFNVVDGEIASTEPMSADGSRRPVSAEGCAGFESAQFSEDGLRVFTRSEFECGAEMRAGTGVMSFIAPTQWIDVRSLEIDGEPVAWVQRYGLADLETLASQGLEDPAEFDRALVRATRARAARDIELEDVEEAAALIDARAVEVWVATNETEFELSGSELVRLADAGLPETVIDVMVAVSYPDRFVVSPEGAAAAERTLDGVYDAGYRRGFRSYLWDPYYRPIGLGYYRYAPFGYYGYGFGGEYYGGYYGYRPATIVVQPAPSGQRGRMVPGRGYTRGSSAAGSGGATPRSSVGGPARARSNDGGGGGGGDGGGGVSGGGGTRSAPSGSSGRTAQPRGN
ncbi:MAG TPA: hypothetical protein VLA09_00685 [Longimicrobiales bacterium]|nr:hypothetical protein [Longimicrobiales bacterium]